MAGAYTLSRGGHVRADMFYSHWPPRVQARVEQVVYNFFLLPGVKALNKLGWGYGNDSMRILEVSINSPAGVPIWPLKMMIPVGATLITLQGVAEVLRCIQCLKDGRWAPRLHDVEELENQILRQAQAAKAEGREPEGAKP
jgi:TRAP-type mannitol/chloroaromatic compound transport system permease small subunit